MHALMILLIGFTALQQAGEFKPEIRKTDDGVRYVSTGVGFDSRINFPPFSLVLVFATRTRAYLADIDVEISSGSRGHTTKIHSQGPWLGVDLPPGNYKVTARTSKGSVLTKTFTITKGRVTRLKLAWNISDEDI